jgi:hypothetical protein
MCCGRGERTVDQTQPLFRSRRDGLQIQLRQDLCRRPRSPLPQPLDDAERLMDWADVTGAMSFEALRGQLVAFDAEIPLSLPARWAADSAATGPLPQATFAPATAHRQPPRRDSAAAVGVFAAWRHPSGALPGVSWLFNAYGAAATGPLPQATFAPATAHRQPPSGPGQYAPYALNSQISATVNPGSPPG